MLQFSKFRRCMNAYHDVRIPFKHLNFSHRPHCPALRTPACSSEAWDTSRTASSLSGPWRWTTQTHTSVWERVCRAAMCILKVHALTCSGLRSFSVQWLHCRCHPRLRYPRYTNTRERERERTSWGNRCSPRWICVCFTAETTCRLKTNSLI